MPNTKDKFLIYRIERVSLTQWRSEVSTMGIVHIHCYYYYYFLFQDYEVLYMEKFITAFLQDLLKFIRQAFFQLCIYAVAYLFIYSFIHLFIYSSNLLIFKIKTCIIFWFNLYSLISFSVNLKDIYVISEYISSRIEDVCLILIFQRHGFKILG